VLSQRPAATVPVLAWHADCSPGRHSNQRANLGPARFLLSATPVPTSPWHHTCSKQLPCQPRPVGQKTRVGVPWHTPCCSGPYAVLGGPGNFHWTFNVQPLHSPRPVTGTQTACMSNGHNERHTMKMLDVPQSGSQAGTTSSRNRFGQYRRTRATPVNVNSAAQQAVRNTLSELSVAWRGLTSIQREAWESFALAHPRVDSLGQSITLTGHQTYVGINSSLGRAGLAAVDVPDNTAPPEPPAVGATTVTAAGFSIAFGATPVPAGQSLVIETSPPLSAGRAFSNDFRVVKVRAAAAVNTLLKADMEAKWGTLSAGQKFFIRASIVDEAGLVSSYESLSVVVT